MGAKYRCEICNKEFGQKSHHRFHLTTEIHKKNKQIAKLELEKDKNIKSIIKKKNFSESEIETYIESILSKKENTMVESIPELNISNKEALKEKIHEIHNFLRNNGAGYGMNALKVFNIFYGFCVCNKADCILNCL